MGAEHVINPHQLTMFERASDLADPESMFYVDWGGIGGSDKESFEKFKTRKIDESKDGSEQNSSWGKADREKSLYESIEKEGVKTPVVISAGSLPDRVLADGHHRVFTQNEINPNAWIPVRWV